MPCTGPSLHAKAQHASGVRKPQARAATELTPAALADANICRNVRQGPAQAGGAGARSAAWLQDAPPHRYYCAAWRARALAPPPPLLSPWLSPLAAARATAAS